MAPLAVPPFVVKWPLPAVEVLLKSVWPPNAPLTVPPLVVKVPPPALAPFRNCSVPPAPPLVVAPLTVVGPLPKVPKVVAPSLSTLKMLAGFTAVVPV